MSNLKLYANKNPLSEGMYLLFPFLFCQLIAIHVVIGFSPHVLFGLGVIYFYGSIIKRHIPSLFLFIIFLVISSFADNAIKQAIQISIEMIYGYLIANFFANRYSRIQLMIFFRNLLVIWFLIICLFLIDYYFTGAFLNKFFEIFTHWKAGGDSTIFARIAIIFGNPNWLSLFYLLIFGLYLQFGGKNIFIIGIAIFTIFLLQTKTAIAISFFLPFVSLYNKTKAANSLLLLLILLILLIFVTVINWGRIYNFYLYVLELSSFVNREVLFNFIAPYIQLYPNGLIGEGSKEAMSYFSNEDSMPSFFLVLRLLGIPLTLILIFYVLNPFKSINIISFTLLFMSITQSFFSISGACSLAFFSIFITYFVSIRHNAKNDLYT